MNQSASLTSFLAIRSRFFCAFFLLSTISAFGQFQKTHDFDKDWYIYQSTWKSYLPYIANKHFNYHSKSIILHAQDYPDHFLKVRPIDSYYLFLNGTYQFQLKKDSTYVFSVDSLMNKYVDASNLILTFYKDDLKGIPSEISLGKKYASKLQLVAAAQVKSLERLTRFKTNFVFISLLLILTLLSILHYSFPKYFYTYFKYSDWFHWEIKDSVIQNTPFALPNILVIVVLSLLSAFVGFYFTLSNPNFFLSQGEELSFYSAFAWVGSRAILALLLFFSRYLIYRIFTSLFKIEFLTKAHFFKAIQTNLQFIALIYASFVLMTLYFGPSYLPNFDLIYNILYVYFIVRVIYFFQIFRKRYHVNAITLGAYLIIIEGQVLFFGLNQILFPSIK
ncbi:hypothetical protein V7S79_08335 [Aquirufa sp. ROCK-SH2]